MDASLTNINIVVQSDWTGDLFVGFDNTAETLILYEGDPDDADLFTRVGELVAEWPCEVVEEASYRVWKRPVDTDSMMTYADS